MLWVSAYGEEIIRLTIDFNGDDLPADDKNPMLEIDAALNPQPLSIDNIAFGLRMIWICQKP